MGSNKKRTARSLATGRPPTISKAKSISRKSTKSLINTHHLLQRRKQQAIEKGDITAATAADAELQKLGGLASYQQASLQGQRDDRGGDSSKVLLEWLQPFEASIVSLKVKPRLLEVGALSTNNACSRSGMFSLERIDLNSQSEGILTQDFMERPLPSGDSERFDVISLSLVVNYVPTPKQRGDMLLRTLKFLRDPSVTPGALPCLFFVLPAPCITNSRYMDEGRLCDMMVALGYSRAEFRITNKLMYSLWKRTKGVSTEKLRFLKKQLHPGGSRNNFSIVLEAPPNLPIQAG